MSTVTINTLAALVQKYYNGALARTLENVSTAYIRLKEKGKVKTVPDAQLSWPVVSSRYSGVTNIKDGGTLPESQQEGYGAALLDYSIFIGTVRAGRLIQMASQFGDDITLLRGALDSLGQQVEAAVEEMARNIHTQLVQNAAANEDELTGFGESVCQDDNEYAGIDRSDASNTFWRPFINDNGGVNRSLTEQLMESMHDSMRYTRSAKTGEIWAGLTAFNSLGRITNQNVRQDDPNNVRGGVQTIYWQDIEVVRMPGLKTTRMLWLDFQSDDGIDLVKQHKDDFVVRPETTNSYDERMSVAGHYQLRTHNPFKQGCLDDVN